MPSEMNKQIYVLDEYITSTKNGIGVFITELLQCLKKMDVDICHVIFNVRQPEIRVCSKNGMKIISMCIRIRIRHIRMTISGLPF